MVLIHIIDLCRKLIKKHVDPRYTSKQSTNARNKILHAVLKMFFFKDVSYDREQRYSYLIQISLIQHVQATTQGVARI